ncbi:MAG: response regulator, partial [Acidobacteriota bacterium]|jgi:CheY-like chemotaxis protein
MRRVILVVDDDPAVLRSYGHLFRRLGCQVVLANDSERVLADPDSLRGVDLLILDQRMPRTCGLDLLATLRRRETGREAQPGAGGDAQAGAAVTHPAVILISAFLSAEIKQRAARLGVMEIIEKPVDIAHLLASVRVALENRPPRRP